MIILNSKNYTKQAIKKASVFLKSQTKEKGVYGSEKMLLWRLKNKGRANSAVAIIRRSERIVSILSCTGKNLWINQKKRFYGEIGDAYTHKSFRRRGYMWKALAYFCTNYQKLNLNGLYSTPWKNAESVPAMKNKAGFISNESLNLVNRIFLLKPFKKIMPKKMYIPKIDTAFQDVILHLFNNLDRMFLRMLYPIIVKKYKALPKKWDDCIWQKIKNNFEIVFERSKKYMQWRYFDSPQKYTLCLLNKKERPVGYFIYSIQRKSFLLADLYVEKPTFFLFFKILKYCIELSIQKKTDRVIFWSSPGTMLDCVSKLMLFAKGSQIMPLFFSPEMKRKKNKRPSFLFQMGDSDNV